MRVMLLGATGLVGGEVLNLALADPKVQQVVAPTRRAMLPSWPGLIGRPPEGSKANPRHAGGKGRPPMPEPQSPASPAADRE